MGRIRHRILQNSNLAQFKFYSVDLRDDFFKSIHFENLNDIVQRELFTLQFAKNHNSFIS